MDRTARGGAEYASRPGEWTCAARWIAPGRVDLREVVERVEPLDPVESVELREPVDGRGETERRGWLDGYGKTSGLSSDS